MSTPGARIEFGSPQIPVVRARIISFTCMLLILSNKLGSSRKSFSTMTYHGSDSDSLRGFGVGFDRHSDQKPITRTLHPRYEPCNVKCSYCKCVGHSLMNCRRRLDHHHDMMHLHCKEGWHKPHLHDNLHLWRCEWCLMHLHETYVREWYPEYYTSERARISGFLRRNLKTYSDSTDSSEA